MDTEVRRSSIHPTLVTSYRHVWRVCRAQYVARLQDGHRQHGGAHDERHGLQALQRRPRSPVGAAVILRAALRRGAGGDCGRVGRCDDCSLCCLCVFLIIIYSQHNVIAGVLAITLSSRIFVTPCFGRQRKIVSLALFSSWNFRLYLAIIVQPWTK